MWRRNDAVFTQALRGQLWEAVLTTCHRHQLRNPLNPAYQRVIPLFEKHLGSVRPVFSHLAHGIKRTATLVYKCNGIRRPTHHGRHLIEHGEYFLNAALIEDSDLNACAYEFGGNIGLQVGKTKNAVGLECQDLVNLGAQKSTHPRLLMPRLRRTHRVTRYPDNARLFPEQVQPLRGFFGQADDALGALHEN